ncbi:MAG: hypothetical protein COW73_10255 [Nitrospirae bacterium CG18_big_fil_WC_8_21_14_2_50_70_55]|nr:type III pantothenate kinase [Deltaproteobacteria bacterium]OIP63180.1 MAG: hypothetical protein AUK30_08950 [Nitrospirae bacterium CG2_30_70_394]PIQ03703.1 MAG: hypothetical protein COW73_10255 [Nitrospirae bacterium CG18_big_fil_WC_8_21_14_2_50_70_55]PIU77520.1 MAG: hypothetical protein COS73_10100 [Nitrospirae bacterium CG06_land_8_20_14_3_00_70_43]PIW82749.1 MAG: hypothetical protein COZ96_07025 [Nitrospirae bacterium CG_4_8_14_3_um_filter_70_85]PIX84152.1 MAG: hypothetical protein COZ3
MLLLDAGNSRLTLARLVDGEIQDRRDLDRDGLTAGAVVQAVEAMGNTTRALVACVVPALTPMLVDVLTVCLGAPPHLVSHHSPHGLTFAVPYPNQAGVDRIAAAVGALARAQPPLIVVDCGTATTCTLIDLGAAGEPCYRGGAIAPGLETALAGLRGRAPHLPAPAAAAEIPGTTTETALALGSIAGHAWMVDALVARLAATAAGGAAELLLTGGCATLLIPHLTSRHTYRPDLGLEGLATLAARLTGARDAPP